MHRTVLTGVNQHRICSKEKERRAQMGNRTCSPCRGAWGFEALQVLSQPSAMKRQRRQAQHSGGQSPTTTTSGSWRAPMLLASCSDLAYSPKRSSVVDLSLFRAHPASLISLAPLAPSEIRDELIYDPLVAVLLHPSTLPQLNVQTLSCFNPRTLGKNIRRAWREDASCHIAAWGWNIACPVPFRLFGPVLPV